MRKTVVLKCLGEKPRIGRDPGDYRGHLRSKNPEEASAKVQKGWISM